MTTERVTVSLPAELRAMAQQTANNLGLPVSTVVAEALTYRLRGRLVDEWLVDYQTTHGPFSESEVVEIAAASGVPYLPPR